jgi:hypothetical protein
MAKLGLTRSLIRFAVILYIQDAELAALFHQEPNFRHNTRPLPAVCSPEVFAAPTAAAWAAKYRTVRQQKVHQPDMLNAYATLSGIGASICEFRCLNLLQSELNSKLADDLVRWYDSAGVFSQATEEFVTQPDLSASLRVLWHHTFMALTVDLNALEVAVGREGNKSIVPGVHEYVKAWISTLDSKRCLFHALYLQNLIVSTSLGSLTAIHTARILFSAALCWYCYILYLPSMPSTPGMAVNSNPDETLDYLMRLPELRVLRKESGSCGAASGLWHKTMSTFQRTLVATPAEMKENTLCVLESTLRRLGTSGISGRFADIIYIFISGEME